DGDVDGARRGDGRVDQPGMHDLGDVVDRPAGVQVRSLAHHDFFTRGGNRIQRIAGGSHAALGFSVERNGTFTPGRGRAAARLTGNQILDRGASVADDERWAAHGGGDQLEVDDDKPQVLAVET